MRKIRKTKRSQYFPDPEEPIISGNKELAQEKPLRRLISLTELIEGESICTAMCVNEDILKITANHTSQKNEAFISLFLEHISDIAAFKLEEIRDIKLLHASLKKYCASNEWRNTNLRIILNDEEKMADVIGPILESSLAPVIQKSLRLKQKFDVGDIDYLGINIEQKKGIITTIADLVRNYKKLLSYLLTPESQDQEWVKLLAKKQYEIIDNTKIVKDKKTVHAELRLIDHILKKFIENNIGLTEETFMAISKLCCIDCKSAIVAINKYLALIGSKGFKIWDTHGQLFYSGWEEPDFFKYPDIPDWYIKSKNTLYPKKQMRGGASSSETESFEFIASEYIATQGLLSLGEEYSMQIGGQSSNSD